MIPCTRRIPHRPYDRNGVVRLGLLILVGGGMLPLSGCQINAGPQSGTYSGVLSGSLTVQEQTSGLTPKTLEITLIQSEDGYSPPSNLFDALVPVGASQSIEYSVSGLEQLLTGLGWQVVSFEQHIAAYDMSEPDQYYAWGWGEGYLPEGDAPATVNSCYMTLDMSGSAQVLTDDRLALDLLIHAWSYDSVSDPAGSVCSTKYGQSVELVISGELTLKNPLASE